MVAYYQLDRQIFRWTTKDLQGMDNLSYVTNFSMCVKNLNLTLLIAAQSFPTPMEEPKKILKAQYLGSTQVTQASGMEVLNDAIDRLVSSVPQDQWQSVNVAVAPSMITIQQPNVINFIKLSHYDFTWNLILGRQIVS